MSLEPGCQEVVSRLSSKENAMQFNMSNFIKVLKANSKSASMSDESFVGELFDPFVVAAGLKNKNGAELRLDKHQVSKLINQDTDVPSEMRKTVVSEDIFDATLDGFEIFVSTYLGVDFLEINQELIWEIIKNDTLVSEDIKRQLEEEGTPTRFLLKAFFEAVRVNNTLPKQEEMVVWSRGNSSLSVIPGNIINKAFPKNNTAKDIIVVIPVNTSFETELTPSGSIGIQLVSENTIHGKWLSTLYGKKVEKKEIDAEIQKSLTFQAITSTHSAKAGVGKQECYPIGTIATYQYRRTIFYLWAVSEFDDKNKAQSSAEEIKGAMEQLLDFYDTYGQGADMYLPLVGTGRSRANMTHQQSYDLIKGSIVANEDKVHGNISIMVLPDDYTKIRIF